MAPSTYYAAKSRAPSSRAQRDTELRPALRALWEDNYRVYGARELWKAARRAGHDVGRDQVARLMRAEGIEGALRTRRVRTTKSDPAATRHPDLVQRNFTATQPNQLWVSDLTFVPTFAGIAYVCHHRRLQPGDRRVARHVAHAHRDGPRRPGDGPMVARHPARGPEVPQRCGQSIHIRSLRRAARRDRRGPIDRVRR